MKLKSVIIIIVVAEYLRHAVVIAHLFNIQREHSIVGGLGSAVAEAVCEGCPVPMIRVGVEDKFGKSGKVPPLLEEYGLTAANIAAKVKEVVAKKAK